MNFPVEKWRLVHFCLQHNSPGVFNYKMRNSVYSRKSLGKITIHQSFLVSVLKEKDQVFVFCLPLYVSRIKHSAGTFNVQKCIEALPAALVLKDHLFLIWGWRDVTWRELTSDNCCDSTITLATISSSFLQLKFLHYHGSNSKYEANIWS